MADNKNYDVYVAGRVADDWNLDVKYRLVMRGHTDGKVEYIVQRFENKQLTQELPFEDRDKAEWLYNHWKT